jgi:hypothetical protein
MLDFLKMAFMAQIQIILTANSQTIILNKVIAITKIILKVKLMNMQTKTTRSLLMWIAMKDNILLVPMKRKIMVDGDKIVMLRW